MENNLKDLQKQYELLGEEIKKLQKQEKENDDERQWMI